MASLKGGSNTLQFLNGFSTLKLHQLVAVTRLHPADAVVGHQETHHVSVTKVGHKGSPVTGTIIATHVASGGKSLLLQTISQSTQAHHEVFYNRPIVLSKTRKHGRRALDALILRFSSGLRE